MDYNGLIERLKFPIWQDIEEPDSTLLLEAATAITDLLARAEAAEEDRDRMREAMKPNCLLCDSMHENGNCTEVGGFCTAVPAAHCPLIPRLRNKLAAVEARAENAEAQLRVAVGALVGQCKYCRKTKNVQAEKVRIFIAGNGADRRRNKRGTARSYQSRQRSCGRLRNW